MRATLSQALALLVGSAAIVVFTMAFRVQKENEATRLYTTLGEVQAVHPRVTVDGREVLRVTRLQADDRVATGEDGRARARLDDGTRIVMDRATTVTVADGRVALSSGRLFVQGAAGARTTLSLGRVDVSVNGATVATTRTDATLVYCVSGEVAVAGPDRKEVHVHGGETAHLEGATVIVAPEKAFNDWTFGMAHAWGATGKPRGAVGELWGTRADSANDAGGSPLAVRSHDVGVTIVGEVATTETRTIYFNAGGTPVAGDFRMAIPDGAIVSGFDLVTGDKTFTGVVRVATDAVTMTSDAQLEWAGKGWLRGKVRSIAPGKTATVVVRYVEWLSPATGTMTYRYPMIGERASPPLGEFHAHIDVRGVHATAVGLGEGMGMEGSVIEVRRADFRPTADLVVELQLRPGALDPERAYVVPSDEKAGAYLVVRSDVATRARDAASEGTTLALVIDTSRSITPPLLDAERALVLGILDALGPADRAVVFASDDHAHPVGGDALGPVDEPRRVAIRAALAGLRPGGATDLGAALERAADALPADLSSATVLYLGDGWPTVGDTGVEAIRTRLARRKGGLPRLGAVAVGPTSNRSGLTALVRASGPVFAIDDASDTPEVAVHLLAEALRPAVSDVQVDLGPDADRVYPRVARTALRGDTVTTVARLASAPPRSVTLRYRDGAEPRGESRALTVLPVVDPTDVRRRWSAARVEELMLRRAGREAVVDAALPNDLLTPWTGWVAAGPAPFQATPLWSRMLDAGLDGGLAVFAAGFTTPRPPAGALRAPSDPPWPKPQAEGAKDAWTVAAASAARRRLDEALGLVRQCRESRASLRPEVGGLLRTELSVSADGRVRHVTVRGASTFEDDPALDHCVELVIESIVFLGGSGGDFTVVHEFRLPEARDPVARRCSPTSTLPSALRRGVWFERLHRASTTDNPLGAHGELAYLRAKATCELPTWSDRRAFLELLLEEAPNGVARVELGKSLDDAGDADAADLVRREAVRRASSPAELEALRALLVGTEPDVSVPFVAAYAKADTNEARLDVVQRFLELAPHDARLRRRELALLGAMEKKEKILAESVAVRAEPFLDVSLLSDLAYTLQRAGDVEESRRTYAEIAERAPEVPFARAFLGDRLRDEGFFDDATAAYEALTRLSPDDPAATFRLALAHAGAGRLDLASRMLAHIAETGGRTSDATLAGLAAMVSSALMAEARGGRLDPGDDDRLRRRGLETPVGDAAGLLLARAPTWVPGFRLVVARDPVGDALAPLTAVPLGIVGVRIDRGEGKLRLRLGRQADLEPARPATAKLDVLVLDGAEGHPRLVTKDVPLRTDGGDTELVWDGTTLL